MNPINAYGLNHREPEIVKDVVKPVNPPPFFTLDPTQKTEKSKKDTKKNKKEGKEDPEQPLKRPFE